MLSFKTWFHESSLRDIIQPVPQSPKHHAEGNVWIHTRMVRKQLNDAIAYFQQTLSDKNSVFGNLDPNLSAADINVLRIGAWMHDIGKASATTIDGEPWKGQDPTNKKIQAIGHESPQHFELMMQKLGQPWQSMYEKAAPQDKEDLWYIIRHHMDLKNTGFGRRMLNQLLDESGKFRNERKIKLLLILIMMDQSGRIGLGELNGNQALPGITGNMQQSAINYHTKRTPPPKEKSTWNDPVAFVNNLKAKGLDITTIQKAFQGKFGRELEESFSFRKFLLEDIDDQNSLKVIIQKVKSGDKTWFDTNNIVVGEKGNYWILNYRQGLPTNQYNLLTRGLVIDKTSGKIVSMPFKRFGNYGEDLGGYKSSVDFSKSEVLEKLDGSMLAIAFPSGDVNQPVWHTRKMISTTSNPKQRGFDGGEVDLMQLAGEQVKTLRFSDKDTDKTWIFEFIHTEQPVVTRYKSNQLGLYLIGCRSLKTLEEYSESDLDKMAIRIGAKRPRRWGVMGSHSAVKQMMSQFADDFEGFVMRQTDTGQRAKVKKAEYFKQHKLIGKTSWEDIIPLWISGETTEIITYFPHVKEKFDKLDNAFERKVSEITETAELYLTHFKNKKELAVALNADKIPHNIQPFVFSAFGEPIKQLKDIIETQIKNYHPLRIVELLGLSEG